MLTTANHHRYSYPSPLLPMNAATTPSLDAATPDHYAAIALTAGNPPITDTTAEYCRSNRLFSPEWGLVTEEKAHSLVRTLKTSQVSNSKAIVDLGSDHTAIAEDLLAASWKDLGFFFRIFRSLKWSSFEDNYIYKQFNRTNLLSIDYISMKELVLL